MTEKLATIDLGEKFSTLDINNISWSNYSEIMIALEIMINLLKTELEDLYHDSHRKTMIDRYEKLFNELKNGYSTYRGKAISLDDTVIDKIVSRIK